VSRGYTVEALNGLVLEFDSILQMLKHLHLLVCELLQTGLLTQSLFRKIATHPMIRIISVLHNLILPLVQTHDPILVELVHVRRIVSVVLVVGLEVEVAGLRSVGVLFQVGTFLIHDFILMIISRVLDPLVQTIFHFKVRLTPPLSIVILAHRQIIAVIKVTLPPRHDTLGHLGAVFGHAEEFEGLAFLVLEDFDTVENH